MTIFYRLDSPDNSALWASYDPDFEQVQVDTCSANPKHRWFREILDLHVVLPAARLLRDIVWTSYSDCLVNDRALSAFRDASLTGFEILPVGVRYKDPDMSPPRYWRLRAVGWGGVAPPESGVRLLERCDACQGLEYSGFTDAAALIREDQWDGSDFFMVWPLTAFIFVSDRVATVVRAAGLRGCVFEDPSRITPHHGTTGARSLSDYMPEARAKKLGEPLGIYWPKVVGEEK